MPSPDLVPDNKSLEDKPGTPWVKDHEEQAGSPGVRAEETIERPSGGRPAEEDLEMSEEEYHSHSSIMPALKG